jgi:stearoyl-CoA desaturase (delta-9 desaturase)
MPTRDELLAEAQATFAKTISLDDVVDHAYELLLESVGVFLTGPSLVAATNPKSRANR